MFFYGKAFIYDPMRTKILNKVTVNYELPKE